MNRWRLCKTGVGAFLLLLPVSMLSYILTVSIFGLDTLDHFRKREHVPAAYQDHFLLFWGAFTFLLVTNLGGFRICYNRLFRTAGMSTEEEADHRTIRWTFMTCIVLAVVIHVLLRQDTAFYNAGP